jgi:probable phosphoglycerate mutase
VNHLDAVERLRNRYFVMRHGQSKANLAGIIVSRVETDASGDYGLSETGREQVLAAARSCQLPAGTLVCSSDFARAAQTARIMAEYLGSPRVVFTPALRERCFGAWEGTPTANYHEVWAADEAGAGGNGVEPPPRVLDRATTFILDLEGRHAGLDILLVSHGDTLQILQAGFGRMDPARHRHLPHLETAEIRPMWLAAAR